MAPSQFQNRWVAVVRSTIWPLGARNIDGRTLRVVESEAVQRAVAAIAADGSLVLLYGPRGSEANGTDHPRGGVEGDRLGVGEIEPPDAGAVPEVDHRIRPRWTPQPQHRRAEETWIRENRWSSGMSQSATRQHACRGISPNVLTRSTSEKYGKPTYVVTMPDANRST